jgi:hypothetical protein
MRRFMKALLRLGVGFEVKFTVELDDDGTPTVGACIYDNRYEDEGLHPYVISGVNSYSLKSLKKLILDHGWLARNPVPLNARCSKGHLIRGFWDDLDPEAYCRDCRGHVYVTLNNERVYQ